MNDDQFQIMDSKIDVIIKLLAIGATKDKSLKEQVAILSSAGLQPKQIGAMLGKTSHHISVIIHDLKKEQSAEETPNSDTNSGTESKGGNPDA